MDIEKFVYMHQLREVRKVVSFELLMSERERLRAICEKHDVSIGNLLRAIVVSWLAMYDQEASHA